MDAAPLLRGDAGKCSGHVDDAAALPAALLRRFVRSVRLAPMLRAGLPLRISLRLIEAAQRLEAGPGRMVVRVQPIALARVLSGSLQARAP